MLSLLLFLSLHVVGATSKPDELLNDPIVMGFFTDLLGRGGFGFVSTESAAFLVFANGAYRCEAWPYDGGFQRHQFRGVMPDRAFALVHTHPKGNPLASREDRETAMRLAIPVFVLTPANIYVVTPDGKSVALIRNRRWWRISPSSSTRCSVPEQRASRWPPD